LRWSRGLSEVFSAIIIMAVVLAGSLIAYRLYAKNVNMEYVGLKEKVEVYGYKSRLRYVVISTKKLSSSYLILIYNYGITTKITKVFSKHGPLEFEVKTFSGGSWVNSEILPSNSLVLIEIISQYDLDEVILEFEGGIHVKVSF